MSFFITFVSTFLVQSCLLFSRDKASWISMLLCDAMAGARVIKIGRIWIQCGRGMWHALLVSGRCYTRNKNIEVLKFRTFITYCLLGYECSKLHSTLAISIRQNKTSKFWSWKLSRFNSFLKSAPIWHMSTWASVPRSVWSSFQVVTLASTSNNYTLLLEVTQQQRSNTPVHSPGQETTDHITIPHPVPNRFLHLISSCISFKIGRIEESGIDSRPGDSHETFCLLRFFQRPLVGSSSISIVARDPSPDSFFLPPFWSYLTQSRSDWRKWNRLWDSHRPFCLLQAVRSGRRRRLFAGRCE